MAKGNLTEVGRSGLQMSGGQVYEEFLTNLRGERGRRAFREMADNDPVIGGILLAFTQTITRLDWRFEVADESSDDDKEIADFLQECFEDMSDDWSATLGSILSMMVYGWSFLEIVYKIRDGRDGSNATRNSKFSDGKIGWRKWAERSQESLLRWETDKNGGLSAMVQTVYGFGGFGQEAMGGGEFIIPIEKALLFRTSSSRNNPEGRSLLRNAYRPHFFKKRIEEIEAIGIERDLAGLPVAWLDPLYFSPNASADERALFVTVQDMVAKVKRNEMEGMVFPLVYDDKGHKLVDFTLMSSGGQRQFDTDKIIARYNQQIAMSVLADFLMLGHENVGSQSLGVTKVDLWMMAVDAMAKAVARVVNHFAVPRLLKLNGMDAENPPELKFGDVDKVDLTVLGNFLKQMTDAGIIVPDMKLEEHIRELASVTPIDEETREDLGAQVPLTPEEMAAYAAAGVTPPATKPSKIQPPGTEPGKPAPKVEPGTKVEVNAKKPATAVSPKAPAAKPKPGFAPKGGK
jgi:hypothetical protein